MKGFKVSLDFERRRLFRKQKINKIVFRVQEQKWSESAQKNIPLELNIDVSM